MAEKTIEQPPIFFPPPPRVVASADSNKPTTFRLNFKTRPSTSDSTASSSSSSSFHKPSITPSSRPAIKPTKSKVLAIKRTRQYILLLQLLLSFSILILSVMFAYCATLPHSDNIHNSASGSASSPLSSSSRRALPTSRILARQTTTTADTIAVQKLSEDASNNAVFTTRPAMASLTFYSATLPLLTMAHTATELLSSLVRPETSQNTRFGNALRSSQGRRITSLLSFTVSTALVLGWVVIQLFWTNCEIVGFMGAKGSNGEAVCPVQIRGHRMAGISGLSIGKVTMGWVIVVIYLVYSVFMYLKVGVLKNGRNQNMGAASNSNSNSNPASFKRRARYETNDVNNADKDRDAEAETVFIGIDVQKPFGR